METYYSSLLLKLAARLDGGGGGGAAPRGGGGGGGGCQLTGGGRGAGTLSEKHPEFRGDASLRVRFHRELNLPHCPFLHRTFEMSFFKKGSTSDSKNKTSPPVLFCPGRCCALCIGVLLRRTITQWLNRTFLFQFNRYSSLRDVAGLFCTYLAIFASC